MSVHIHVVTVRSLEPSQHLCFTQIKTFSDMSIYVLDCFRITCKDIGTVMLTLRNSLPLDSRSK